MNGITDALDLRNNWIFKISFFFLNSSWLDIKSQLPASYEESSRAEEHNRRGIEGPLRAFASMWALRLRAIFNWVSKVIRKCIGFGSLCIVIGLENSRHPLSQSDAKLKPIAIWSLAFSRAWGRLHAFTLSSHWLLMIFTFVLIGRCDYFGFGFATLNIENYSILRTRAMI